MTLAQKRSYWSRWQRAAAWLLAHGTPRDRLDAKRRAITAKALGYAKSMSDWKRWTNAEVDKVFAAFAAVYDGGNLDAQLTAQEQPENRKGALDRDCRMLADACVDGWKHEHDVAERDRVAMKYLNGLARRICFKPYAALDERELAKLKGVLHARLAQLERAAAKVAQEASTKEDPF